MRLVTEIFIAFGLLLFCAGILAASGVLFWQSVEQTSCKDLQFGTAQKCANVYQNLIAAIKCKDQPCYCSLFGVISCHDKPDMGVSPSFVVAGVFVAIVGLGSCGIYWFMIPGWIQMRSDEAKMEKELQRDQEMQDANKLEAQPSSGEEQSF